MRIKLDYSFSIYLYISRHVWRGIFIQSSFQSISFNWEHMFFKCCSNKTNGWLSICEPEMTGEKTDLMNRIAITSQWGYTYVGSTYYTIIAFIWGMHRKLSIRRWLTTWCSSRMKAITVLLYRNYSKMFKNVNVLFLRRLQNNFRYSKYNYETGL